MVRLKPYGPRGGMLLGFAMTACALGLSYTTDQGTGSQLFWLDSTVPLEYLGFVWFIIGIWLAVSAYRVEQYRALGAFAGICFLWGAAYAASAIINLTHGAPPTGYILIPIFFGQTIACASAVRMFNPGRSHIEIALTTQRPTDTEE